MTQNSLTHSILCLSFALLVVQAEADIFVLRDGTTLDGEVSKETEDSYVLELQISRSIKDERVILKSDIASRRASKKDMMHIKEVVDLLPTPDFLTVRDYEARVAVAKDFLEKFPESSRAKQAEAIIGILMEEMDKVKKGSLKMDGKFMTAAEYRANLLDVDAAIGELKIRKLIRDGHFFDALREYEVFERDFGKTKAYSNLRPLICQAIELHISQTSAMLADFELRDKERTVGLERMSTQDRVRAQTAIQEETSALDARYSAEKGSKRIWITPHPFHKQSLTDSINAAKRELTRMSTPLPLNVMDAGSVYRSLLSRIENGEKYTLIAKELMDAKKKSLIGPRYFVILEEAAKQNQ